MRIPHIFGAQERPLLDDEILQRIFVDELLSGLTERERKILHLLYWKDLSCTTVAQMLGEEERGYAYSDSTIRYHEAKILKKLLERARNPSEVDESYDT